MDIHVFIIKLFQINKPSRKTHTSWFVISFTKMEPDFFGESADYKTGTENVEDESGMFCSERK